MKTLIKQIFEINNLVFLVAFFIAVGLIYSTVKVVYKNYTLQQKVDVLNGEIAVLELEKENARLNNEYYKTDAYLELQAREKLNKVVSGEQVLILPKQDQEVLDGQAAPDLAGESETQNNVDQWLYFLFGRQPG